MILFTLKLPFFLHGLDFYLEEVKKLGGVGHPEHQRSKVRGELLDIWGTELTLWFCRAEHDTIHNVSHNMLLENTKFLFSSVMLADKHCEEKQLRSLTFL